MKFRTLYSIAFILLWIGLDFIGDRINMSGLSSPWYPQAALSVSLLLARGWGYFWLVPFSKLSSSLAVWPGPLAERIVPTLIFTIGIALLGIFLEKIQQNKGRSDLLTGLLATGLVALLCAPMAILRQAYYHWHESGGANDLTNLAKLSWENWLGDTTAIVCLMPCLRKLMGNEWRSSLATAKRVVREYWSLFLALALMIFPIPLMPEEMSHRPWYLLALPCLALSVFSGLEAALVATFLTNVALGTIAVAFLPRVYMVDLQIFLLSLNLVSLLTGAMVKESRQRLEELSRLANQALEAQFIKVQALMKIQGSLLEPLRALEEEAQKAQATDLFSPVTELLSRLNTLNEQENEPEEKASYPAADLVEEWQRIATEQTPAGAPLPELTVSGPLPSQIFCDRAAARTVFRQLVNLVLQLQAANTKPRLFVSAQAGFLLFRAEIHPSSAFSSSEIDFWRSPKTLPAGGYALTAFVLHSLVRKWNGRMDIYPHYFSFRERIVAEIQLPLLEEGQE